MDCCRVQWCDLLHCGNVILSKAKITPETLNQWGFSIADDEITKRQNARYNTAVRELNWEKHENERDITNNNSKTVSTTHADETMPKADSLYKGLSQRQMGI